jgi:hypothetical protein
VKIIAPFCQTRPFPILIHPQDLLPMKEDYFARGFQKIHDDLAFLMHCFREVLEELGEQHLANNLPWINEVRIDLTPNPRLCQAYSILSPKGFSKRLEGPRFAA